MSRIKLSIDQLVLKGIDSSDHKALVESLQSELAAILANRATRAQWARSHRTPVLRLGSLPLNRGPSGGRTFGASMARAIGKGLTP